MNLEVCGKSSTLTQCKEKEARRKSATFEMSARVREGVTFFLSIHILFFCVSCNFSLEIMQRATEFTFRALVASPCTSHLPRSFATQSKAKQGHMKRLLVRDCSYFYRFPFVRSWFPCA